MGLTMRVAPPDIFSHAVLSGQLLSTLQNPHLGVTSSEKPSETPWRVHHSPPSRHSHWASPCHWEPASLPLIAENDPLS